MTVEPGFVAPVFLLLAKCRHPLLRRQALRLLSQLEIREGIWNTNGARMLAERIIVTEEANLGLHLPLYFDEGSEPAEFIDSERDWPKTGDGAGEAWSDFVPRYSWDNWPRVDLQDRIIENCLKVDVPNSTIHARLLRLNDQGVLTMAEFAYSF